MATRLEQCDERAAVELSRAVLHFEVEIDFERRKAEARLDSERARRVLVEAELEGAYAWYRSPIFVAAVTVAATFGAVTVIGYSWGQIQGR